MITPEDYGKGMGLGIDTRAYNSIFIILFLFLFLYRLKKKKINRICHLWCMGQHCNQLSHMSQGCNSYFLSWVVGRKKLYYKQHKNIYSFMHGIFYNILNYVHTAIVKVNEVTCRCFIKSQNKEQILLRAKQA